MLEEVQHHEGQASRVLVVDDHPLVREAVKWVFAQTPDLRVRAAVAHPQAALDALAVERFDLVLVDLALAGGSGFALIRQIRRMHAEVPILVLSVLDEQLYGGWARDAGADGYLNKCADPSDFVATARVVAAGASRWRCSSQSRGLKGLTVREFEVFELLAQGLGTRDIAAHLAVGVKTVETYRRRIRGKLGLANGAELVRYAIVWRETELLPALRKVTE